MRTMSAINSRASTPRSGTLRSHNDLHFGSGIITGSYNMSTGTRTLDRSCTGSFDRPTYECYGRSSSCERPGLDRSCPGSFDRHRNNHDSDFIYPSPPLRSSLRTFQSRHDVEPDALDATSVFTRKRSDVETNARSEPATFTSCKFMSIKVVKLSFSSAPCTAVTNLQKLNTHNALHKTATVFLATVCKTVCTMLSEHCLLCRSVCPVSNVGVLVAKQFDGHPAAPPQRGTATQFLAHVCCGQMAGWIKMPLGKEVGLSRKVCTCVLC